MRHGSLFSGIGGFDLAAEWMGWENVFHCEWNEFGQRVLKYYWPKAELFKDITKSDFSKYAGKIDILTGGFPCQPYSQAGKRLGKEDDRHLWPYMLRAIREIRPRWIVGENVLGLVNWNGGLVFDEVQSDLEAEGYEVQPYILPACAKNAPHRRDRVWFVAYSGDKSGGSANGCKDKREWELLRDKQKGSEIRSEGSGSSCFRTSTDSYDKLLQGGSCTNGSHKAKRHFSTPLCNGVWQDFPTISPICSGDDGLSERLDGITFSKWRNESIKAMGNAVVPQVVYEIFKAIEAYELKNQPL